MKRFLDLVISLIGLALLLPFLLIIALGIALTSRGGVFFRGVRVGRHGEPFRIFKFRTMRPDSEGNGAWNVGVRDTRVTPIGLFLRKTKLDELPQLLNVLRGEMSLVGPRPELQHYVDMYTDEERRILEFKPGITDWASLVHIDQFAVFSSAEDPDEAYLSQVRPVKLKLQLYYLDNNSLLGDAKILLWTILRLVVHDAPLPKSVQQVVELHRDAIARQPTEGESL